MAGTKFNEQNMVWKFEMFACEYGEVRAIWKRVLHVKL